MGFYVKNKLIGSLYKKQKQQKSNPEMWHSRVSFGTGRAKLLAWGNIFLL